MQYQPSKAADFLQKLSLGFTYRYLFCHNMMSWKVWRNTNLPRKV